MPVFTDSAQLCEWVNGECVPARDEAEDKILDPATKCIGCMDPQTLKGDWNPPGSAVLLYLERPDLLRRFISLNAGGQVEFYTHTACGYKFAMGYTTREQQEALVDEFVQAVTAWGKEFGCEVYVCVEEAGSASPFMTDIAA